MAAKAASPSSHSAGPDPTPSDSTLALVPRASALNGVPAERVWASRKGGPGDHLYDERRLRGFRFLVAREVNCGDGRCELRLDYYGQDEHARKRVDLSQAEGENATMFTILPRNLA